MTRKILTLLVVSIALVLLGCSKSKVKTEIEYELFSELAISNAEDGYFKKYFGESNGALLVAVVTLPTVDKIWGAAAGNLIHAVKEDGSSTAFHFDGNSDATCVSYDDIMYVMGGVSPDGISDKVFSLTWNGEEVITVPFTSLPIPIRGGTATVIDGKIYMLGGTLGNTKTNTHLFCIDLTKEGTGWQDLGETPKLFENPKIIVQSGAIYVFENPKGASIPERSYAYRAASQEFLDAGWFGFLSDVVHAKVIEGFAAGQSGMVLLSQADEQFRWGLYNTVTDVQHDLEGIGDKQQLKNITKFNGQVYGLDQGEVLSIYKVRLVPGTSQLSLLDYLMLLLYLGALITIGFFFSKKTKTTKDYFLGGRKIPYWAVGISLYATGTSAISFLAIPTKTYVTNQVYGLGSLWGPLFIIIAAFLIVPVLRRLDITSTYQYLQRRFNQTVRLFGAFLSVVFQIGGRMSIVLLLPSLALSAVTGIDVFWAIAVMGILATVYTFLGGISAVIWSDVLQVVILFGGAILAFIMMIAGTDGGFSGFVEINLDHSKFDAFKWGWDWGLPVFWIFMLNQLMFQATFPADQVMVQRVFTAPSVSEARKGYILLGLIVVPGTILFHLLGSSLFSYFHSHPEVMNPAIDNIQVFPLYIVEVMPSGVTGLLIAALFAACMSTLDSSINSVTTVVLTDFFPSSSDDHKTLKRAKLLTLFVGLLGTGMALLMATFEIKSMFDWWMQVIALIGGGFGGVFMLGIFSKRANGPGVLIGAIASIFVTILARQYTDMHFMLYSTVAIVSCMLIGYLASLAFPPVDKDLTGLTRGV